MQENLELKKFSISKFTLIRRRFELMPFYKIRFSIEGIISFEVIFFLLYFLNRGLPVCMCFNKRNRFLNYKRIIQLE